MPSAASLARLNLATLELFAPGLCLGNYVTRAHAFIAALLPKDLSGYGAEDFWPTEMGAAWFREGRFTGADKELLELGRAHLENARRLAIAQSLPLEREVASEMFTAFGFSPRESEVLGKVVEGKTNAEIGSEMRLRTDTVSAYIRTIYIKMGVSNRVAAVLRALALVRSLGPATEVAFQVETARMPQ